MSAHSSTTRSHLPVLAVIGFAAAAVVGTSIVLSVRAVNAKTEVAAEDMNPDVVTMNAGWTRAVLSESYLVVINVLPAEPMFDEAEHVKTHATEGELIIEGGGEPTGLHMRHVEAHVYDRETGAVVTDVVPRIVVTNRTTGEVVDVEPTLMQDVNIGVPDQHFGNNVMITPDSDLTLRVTLGSEEVSVDGHLD